MQKQYDIIFIAGAPGTGKSSVSQLLQQKLKSPCFEFCWIPEFRQNKNNIIPYHEEEQLAFENLILVIKNYIKHDFNNIIITDLEDKRISELYHHFKNQKYILFTLTIDNDNILSSRILDESRTSQYRNVEEALKINKQILQRSLFKNEIRIDTTNISITQVVQKIIDHLN